MNARGSGEAYAWLCANVAYQGEGCLIWPFCRNPETGYGTFGHLSEHYYAHRFMCELVNGPPPSSKHHATHSCGKGHDGCVHPKHLEWKTPTGNLLDRRRHGTVRYNTAGFTGILTEDQVAQVRALKGIKSQYEIARMFGVGRPAIQYWHSHDRPHAKPGTSYGAIQRQKLKAAAKS